MSSCGQGERRHNFRFYFDDNGFARDRYQYGTELGSGCKPTLDTLNLELISLFQAPRDTREGKGEGRKRGGLGERKRGRRSLTESSQYCPSCPARAFLSARNREKRLYVGAILQRHNSIINIFKTAKAVNEDPACLYVGSHRRSNQPNLKNRR